jgi:hypothetical protein
MVSEGKGAAVVSDGGGEGVSDVVSEGSVGAMLAASDLYGLNPLRDACER